MYQCEVNQVCFSVWSIADEMTEEDGTGNGAIEKEALLARVHFKWQSLINNVTSRDHRNIFSERLESKTRVSWCSVMFCDVLCTSGSQVLLISWPVTCPILIAGDPSEAEAEIGASLRTWYRWHPLPKEPWCPSIKHGMRKANRPTDETWWEAATKQKRSLAGLLSGVKWSIVKLLRMLEFSCPALGFLPHHQRLSQWTRVWRLTLGSRNVTWRA